MLRQAQFRLRSQLGVEHGRVATMASRMVALAWFAFLAALRDQLGQIGLHQLVEAVLSTALPVVALLSAGWKLRQLRVQAFVSHLPGLRMQFAPAPLLQRLALPVAEFAARVEMMLSALQMRVMRDAAAITRSVWIDLKLVADWIKALSPYEPEHALALCAGRLVSAPTVRRGPNALRPSLNLRC